MATYRVDKQNPVLFLGNAGGGPGEYGFPNLPNAPVTVVIDFPLGAGESILQAWYAPIDNIAALMQFATIDVNPGVGQVAVSAHGYPNTVTRVRISLYALIQKP
jgi:hypothetical protein